MCKELDMVFPKQLEDPKQQKSYMLTPLVTFKELVNNVDKMQVWCQVNSDVHFH